MKRRIDGRRVGALVVAAAATVAPFAGIPSAGAADGTISGVAFKDANRDGVKQAGEEALSNQYIWLFDATNTYLRNAQTDASGAYQLTGVADGTYHVKYWSTGWYELWMDWTPSTMGSLQPMTTIQVAGAAVVDFGFRPIVRSMVESSPISTLTAPSGLKVHSYNDVVTAQDVYSSLMQGSLFGGEAASTILHFAWGTGDYCTSSVGQVAGRYGEFTAGCQIDFSKWLTFGDKYLFHEYGHAWGVYHAYVIQQDPSLSGYLTARGINGDPRLGSSHAWSSYEMLAEDYRTLFGSPTARVAPQENIEIPAASAVAGLRDYLSTTFMTPPAAPPPPPPPDPVSTTSHVGDLDGQATTGNRSWTVTVTAAVKDGSGQPVTGASVSLSMGSGKQAKTYSCTTSSVGRCSVAVSLGTKTSSASLSVTGVTKAGLTYTPSANSDPDGDSNGTLIVVSKPV